ncbi:MAG: hypothetical protein ABFS17_13900 [Chloroflexota bacterium]
MAKTINIQRIETDTRDHPGNFPRLSRFEIEALIYALRKLTREWLLQERELDER